MPLICVWKNEIPNIVILPIYFSSKFEVRAPRYQYYHTAWNSEEYMMFIQILYVK